MKGKNFTAFILITFFILAPISSAFAISFAKITINSLTFHEDGLAINWIEKSSQSSSWPTLGTYWDMLYDFNAPFEWGYTSAGEQQDYAGATAETRTGNIDFIYSYTWISNQYVGDDLNTQIDRFGFFNVSGNGTLSVDADYTIELFLEDEGDFEYIWARGVGYVKLGKHDSSGNVWDVLADNQWGGVNTMFSEYGSHVFDGTLHIEHAYSDGELGMFDISGQSAINGVNPVPEPTTMLLLGSGLAGLTAFRRKFRRQS